MARKTGRGHPQRRPSGAPRRAQPGRAGAPRQGGGRAPSAGSQPRGGPLAARRDAAAAPPSPLRRRVERASTPVLVAMSRLPRLLVPALIGVLVITALGAPAWAALPALGLVLLFVGWLTFLSWPVIATSGRLMRFVLLVLLAAIALRQVHL